MRVHPVSLTAFAVHRPNQFIHASLFHSHRQNSTPIRVSHSNKHKTTHQFQSNTTIQTTPSTYKHSNSLDQTHTNSTIHSHSNAHNNTRNSPNSAFQYCVCGISYQAHFSNRFDRETHQVHPEHCIHSHNLKLKLANLLLIERIDLIASPNEKQVE